MQEARGLIVEEFESAQPSTPSVFLRIEFAFFDRYVGTSGQFTQSFRERQVFVCHDEPHGISSFSATEAAVGLPPGTDVERRSLFVVERAVSLEVSACPFQVEPVGCDKFYNVRSAEDLLNGFIGDAWHLFRTLAW